MANFDKYTNYNDKAGITGVVFGANAPVLEVELNEMQEIQKTWLRDFFKTFRSGVFSSPSIISETMYYNNNTREVIVSGDLAFVHDGYFIRTDSLMRLSVPSGVTSTNVYIQFWEETVSSDDTLKENGYQLSDVTIPNYIKDSRFSVETSKRKVLKFTLSLTEDTTKHNLKIMSISNGTGTVSSDLNYLDITEISFAAFEAYDEVLNSVSKTNPVFTGSLSMGRKAGTTVGTNSVALGTGNTASGSNSMAVGEGNTASGMRAIALGYNNIASGGYSFAVGNNNTSANTGSIAMGYKSSANADYAFAIGNNAKANGTYAFCIGSNNTALQNQLALGCHNNTTLATQGALSGADTGTFLVVGNGTSSAKSNAFRVQGDGAVYSKGAYNATGADYAEYAEWADGNPDNEDRRGYFVTFDEEKPHMIRKAKATDIDILGVVSGNPCVIGNSDECWTKQFLTDEFGNFLYETVEEDFEFVVKDIIKQVDPKTGNITEEEVLRTEIRTLPVRRYIQNPDYDPEKEYVHRRDRKEWSAVGWIGVLPVREDGTCEVGGYCTWGDKGIATKAEPSRFNYRVLERVNDNIIKVAIK